MEMRYCMHCGHKLDEKYLMGEGMVPYCPSCAEFRFPVYNTAVSMIVMNKELDKVLLIKQYGRDSYILVAGYVNKGEDAEDAAARFGVQFLYRDFRPYFKAGQERARALGFYMQKYCGCVFSEEERYLKANKILR